MENEELEKYSALVAFEGKSTIFKMDVIKLDGRFWLVPNWLETEDGTWKAPERIVALDQLKHQVSGRDPADFVINDPVPEHIVVCADPKSDAPFYEIHVHSVASQSQTKN